MRENMINRLYEQHGGYWRNGLHGLDVLTDADQGAVLVDYLGMSESQIADAVQRMVADGRHELAGQTLRRALARTPDSARLVALQRTVSLKLMEQYQSFSPFKFILYSAQAGQAVPPMTGVTPAASP